MTQQQTISVGKLFLLILRISATTLGGGAVLIGVIHEEMKRRNLLSDEEVSNMMTLSLSAPGAMGISMSFQVGWALCGLAGALAAVIAMTLPPFVAILVLVPWLLTHMGVGAMSAFFSGAAAGLVVLMGAIVWKIMAKTVIPHRPALVVCLIISAAMILFGLPPLWALLGGTAFSLSVQEWLRWRKGS